MTTVYKSYQELEDEDHERYLKKQEDIFQRRKAKREAEGFKCTIEGCGQSFKEMYEQRNHINDHQDELRKSMKCSQPKCSHQFNNRRAYNEHIEMHKDEFRLKTLNSIRSVLLYNKHGLLVEAFEREFRGMVGTTVPYKALGFNSAYDLVTNLPDVVQVTQLDGGQTLLHGVPDKKTEHIAKMVGNQRANREGFNYRTGEVLASVGREDKKKIEKAVNRKSRSVPVFMKKQVEQLIEVYAFEDGMDLLQFSEVYDQEFGYPLEFQCYGYYTLEDFVFHGLEGSVELELDGFSWKMVSVGYKRSGEGMVTQLEVVSNDVKNNIKKLLDENPFGISVKTFTKKYDECFGQLNTRLLRCKDLVELCLLIPEICVVHKSDVGDCTILPSVYQVKLEKDNGKSSLPLWVLAEVKNNTWKLLQTLSFGVTLPTFVKGYEGFFGYLNLADLQCQDMMDLCRLMPDVCSVKPAENGDYMIGPTNKLELGEAGNLVTKDVAGPEPSVKESIVMNIKRVLVKNPAGVNLSVFNQKYFGTVGENLDAKMLGFTSLKSLLKSLDTTLFKIVGLGQDLLIVFATENLASLLPGTSVSLLTKECIVQTGWGNVVKVVNPEVVYLQMDGMMDKVAALDDEMEMFYTRGQNRQIVLPETVVVGLAVAALYTDMAWYRGRVVAIKEEAGMAEIYYVDHGQSALVKIATLHHLDSKFGDLPEQVVAVKLSGMKVVGGGKQWPGVVVEELRNILGHGKGRVWVQKRAAKIENDVDLFKKCTARNGCRCGEGKMISVKQVLVKRGLVVDEKVHSVLREDFPVVLKLDEAGRTLQKLILASLGRIRAKERKV